jgi:hypothetical protein
MRNIATRGIAAIALSLSIASVASASSNTDGGEVVGSKVLIDNSSAGVIRGLEGARNYGEESSLGFILPNNLPSQSAAMPEREYPNAE